MNMEEQYISALKKELVPALGCTEPIAIAYAAAKAREVLGCLPERAEVRCSGNIIKNVKAVTVPNSNGLRGIDVAAVLGIVGGNASRELQVLEEIRPEHIQHAKQLLQTDYITCSLQQGVANLYIAVTVYSAGHSAQVTIADRHTNIIRILRDGEVLYEAAECQESAANDWFAWSVNGILAFARTVDVDKVKDILQRQLDMNSKIAQEGLTHAYGTQVGQTLLETYGHDVRTRARARAAAGSDARMGGCSLPVVINSGSGNQGMTVSLPVLEYAREWQVPEDKLYRALLISNLISLHLKHYIGNLSAFCGAVTASCGVGAAITFLAGGDDEAIARTITNTAANVGGILCDGAKASCAAKIASSVDAAILAHHMSMKGLSFQDGEGIVQADVEHTARSVGYVGRVGMKSTDVEILNIMLGQNTEE